MPKGQNRDKKKNEVDYVTSRTAMNLSNKFLYLKCGWAEITVSRENILFFL